jgi:hypothetical protein
LWFKKNNDYNTKEMNVHKVFQKEIKGENQRFLNFVCFTNEKSFIYNKRIKAFVSFVV